MKLTVKQGAVLLSALAGLAGAASITAGKLGLVDVDKVIGVTKSGPSFAALQKKADADLSAQAKTIQELQAKVSSGRATLAERQALSKAQATFQASSKSYADQREKAFAPVASSVNAAVATAAKAQGYTVVFDKRKAASSGVIIYANTQSTELTAAVQKVLKK
ncbi:OmpH family outer membrane protein [Deinococcus irradiatisoli]|uniref:OmpH family outer membrane protein n=1 Tax=Deinococcus irradiatisoli TaxID=2202254 RepID=UPI0015E87534|nr:OmpH family outer membrane protein [Deinococcus irradiatisoli]